MIQSDETKHVHIFRANLFLCNEQIIIIIMYVFFYHALVNALSAHIIHINLNTIISYTPKQ